MDVDDVGESVHRYRCVEPKILWLMVLVRCLALGIHASKNKSKSRSHLRGNGDVDRGLLTVASAPLLRACIYGDDTLVNPSHVGHEGNKACVRALAR